VLAIDLAGEDARPVTEAQMGEGRLGHQVVHGQTESHVRVLRPEQLEIRGGSERNGAQCAVGLGHVQLPP
jgi:hypothetical protein